MTDGEREKIKLRATYFNGIAIALMAVGVFGPYVALAQLFRSQGTDYQLLLTTVLAALGFAWFSTRAHGKAVSILGRLDE